MSHVSSNEEIPEAQVQIQRVILKHSKIWCKFCVSSHNRSYDAAHKRTNKHRDSVEEYLAAEQSVRMSIRASSSSSLSDIHRGNRLRLEGRSSERRVARIEASRVQIEEIEEDEEMKDDIDDLIGDMKLDVKE